MKENDTRRKSQLTQSSELPKLTKEEIKKSEQLYSYYRSCIYNQKPFPKGNSKTPGFSVEHLKHTHTHTHTHNMSQNFWKIEEETLSHLLKERFASILGCFRWLLLFFLFLLFQLHLHNLSSWKSHSQLAGQKTTGRRPLFATHRANISPPRWLSGRESAS